MQAVAREGGETRVLLDADPGFAVEGEGMRHLFFPHREIPGKVRYRLRTSAFVRIGDGSITSVGEARFSGF